MYVNVGEVTELKGFAVIVLVLRSLLFFCFEGVERRVVFCAPFANFVETHLYTSSGLLLIICVVHKSPSSDVYNTSEEENGRNKNR